MFLLFKNIFKKYNQIDILINNAGVSVFEPFEERNEERFDWVMNVNLKGTFNCIQKYVANYDSINQKQGCIINIASMYGLIVLILGYIQKMIEKIVKYMVQQKQE